MVLKSQIALRGTIYVGIVFMWCIEVTLMSSLGDIMNAELH
jgi:hypothetical protein